MNDSTFDATKNYKKVCYRPDRDLQNTELNEAQDMESHEREVLFDRFVRGGRARQLGRQGLGLGLAITREVARRHGGDCVLERSPLGGLRARLTLRLPAPLSDV